MTINLKQVDIVRINILENQGNHKSKHIIGSRIPKERNSSIQKSHQSTIGKSERRHKKNYNINRKTRLNMAISNTYHYFLSMSRDHIL